MNALPHSIETALAEADFSPTEILILKRLLEDDAMTIRQIAAKTGKSTGLLDQAMKKLLRKEIVAKEWINEGFKYTLVSLDAVAHWMADDLRKKHEMMLRKHQNFETFIATLKIDKQRPEFHYYDGLDGLAQAYRELLKGKGEMLSFIPVFCSVEDDPLRDFRVEFFRERRRKGIFQRVIAHNTPLGRRFQSRDAFEYRQSVLISEEHFPFNFEKAMVGDVMVCFNHNEKRACLMKYPELAAMERGMFEGIWREASKKDVPTEVAVVASAVTAPPTAALPPMPVPLSTRTLSQLREFFLSRKSLGVFAGFALLAGLLTYGLYWNNYNINVRRLQERALSIVKNSIHEIDPALVSQIHTIEDQNLPAFAKLHDSVTSILHRNSGASDIWIMRYRPDRSPDDWEFVIDADPIDPALPGEPYNDAGAKTAWIDIDTGEKPAIHSEMTQVIAYEPFTDKWGTWITANGPIRDQEGNTVGVLGVDIEAAQAGQLTMHSLPLGLSFFGLFLAFVLIRLAAFNRSLLSEIGTLINAKKLLRTLPISLGLAMLCSVGMYFYTSHLQLERMRDKLESIAVTAALQINANDLDALRVKEDWKKPEWDKVVTQLEDIRLKNDGVTFTYIVRKTDDPNNLQFVADSHSRNPFVNVDNETSNDIDADNDGKIDPEGHDLLQWPGQKYALPNEEVLAAYNGPVSTENFYEDTWGKYLTGYSPIYNFQGEPVAVIGIDMKEIRLQELVHQFINPVLYFVLCFLLFFIVQLIVLNNKLAGFAWKALKLRQTLVALTLCAEVAFFCSLGLYYYSLYQAKEEIGQRLMSIAATTATEFDANDLSQLKKAGDMHKIAYQKVFKKLNAIRNNNSDIVVWAYILRTTTTDSVWEFVADADSNYFLPSFNDFNLDGTIDYSDGNVAPGVSYFNVGNLDPTAKKPYFTKDIYSDQWGSFVSGLAPIIVENKVIATVGFDSDISEILEKQKSEFKFVFWFLSAFSILLFTILIFKKNSASFI